MDLQLLSGGEIATLVAFAFGLTYIVTGSQIGLFIRFFWCRVLFQWSPVQWLGTIATCPPCNAFWSGALVGLLFGPLTTFTVLQVAVTSCGVTALIQKILGGDGIAANDVDEV